MGSCSRPPWSLPPGGRPRLGIGLYAHAAKSSSPIFGLHARGGGPLPGLISSGVRGVRAGREVVASRGTVQVLQDLVDGSCRENHIENARAAATDGTDREVELASALGGWPSSRDTPAGGAAYIGFLGSFGRRFRALDDQGSWAAPPSSGALSTGDWSSLLGSAERRLAASFSPAGCSRSRPDDATTTWCRSRGAGGRARRRGDWRW